MPTSNRKWRVVCIANSGNSLALCLVKKSSASAKNPGKYAFFHKKLFNYSIFRLGILFALLNLKILKIIAEDISENAISTVESVLNRPKVHNPRKPLHRVVYRGKNYG